LCTFVANPRRKISFATVDPQLYRLYLRLERVFFLTIVVFHVLLLIRRCFQYRHLAVSSCSCISIYLPSRENSKYDVSVIL